MCERLEDLQDVEAIRQAQTMPEELLPASIVDDLLSATTIGERIAVWMKYRGLSQTMLAEQSGVNRSYISEIVNNKKPGSVQALKAIAITLDVELEDLV